MAVLYATVADLRESLNGTDAGTGSPAQLSDAQLTLAIGAASNRVSVYAGGVYDSSQPAYVPPDIFGTLTLDLAGFLAWKIYLKGKTLEATHPAWLAYTEAMKMLDAARNGEISLFPQAPGSNVATSARVINRLPGGPLTVFQMDDSNTTIDAQGNLEASVPSDMWRPGFDDWLSWGAYQ